MMDLSQSIALVTGGAQGIGRSLAEHLLAAGAKVAIGDVAKAAGLKTQQELEAKYHGKTVFLNCDVTKPQDFEDAVKATIQTFGGLNILINNAGIMNESEKAWAVMLKINAEGVVTGTKMGIKYMSKENGGNGGIIVNISSITSLTPSHPLPVYSGTKAFVNQFSRSYGHPVRFEQTGVKVVALNLGLTNTPILKPQGSFLVDDTRRTLENFKAYGASYKMQEVDNVGRGLITILKTARTGSLWTIENNEAPYEIKIFCSKL